MAETPVVFIHGRWLHASCWQPWMQLFGEHGYQPHAPGWPGDADTVAATRENPDAVAGHGIEEVTEHYAKIITALDEAPILVGHSFGGMIVEKLLGENYGEPASPSTLRRSRASCHYRCRRCVRPSRPSRTRQTSTGPSL